MNTLHNRNTLLIFCLLLIAVSVYACKEEDAGGSSGKGNQPAPTGYDITAETFTSAVTWSTTASDRNFTSKHWNSPLAWFNGATYIVYTDTNRIPRIARIPDGGGAAQDEVIDNYQSLDDGHHMFSLGLDEQGYIHVVGDMHNYPGANTAHLPGRLVGKYMYWRSTTPEDISAFSWIGGGAIDDVPFGTSTTYPRFFNDNNGRLFLVSRIRMPVRQCGAVSSYDTTSRKWTLIGGPTGVAGFENCTIWCDDPEYTTGSNYIRVHPWCLFDSRNRLHVVANLIDGAPNDAYVTRHWATHCVYFRHDIGGQTTRADGTTLQLPARIESGPYAGDIVHNRLFLATPSYVAVDSNDNPLILLREDSYTSTGSTTEDKLFAWSGTAWVSHGDLGIGNFHQLFNGADGVITVTRRQNSGAYIRFFDPAGPRKLIDTPYSPRAIDRSYLAKQGNFQALIDIGGASGRDRNIGIMRTIITRP